jgi:predicted patatin/cPLA2 family phospholipase
MSVPRHHRVLIIEGGGMKAAYANGVLTAFERAGFGPWDAVIGTSAGGALAAWYSAHQAEYAEGTWKYAADPRIISYRRALTLRGPLLDHEALWSEVYQKEHPLDLDAVRAAKWGVHVTVADVETGEVFYPDVRHGDTGGWIRATGRLPFAAGPAVEVDGRRYVDGGVVDPIPLRWALDTLGSTEITLITNKPPGPQRPDPRLVLELAARRYPAFRAGLFAHQDRKQQAYALAAAPPPGVRVQQIHPSRPTRVGRLTRDQRAVRAALELGRADGEAHLSSLDTVT